MDKPTNSLERLKLWIDLPYYIRIAGNEKKLDKILITSGLREDDLIDPYNTTGNLSQLFASPEYTEVKMTSEKRIQVKTPSGYVPKTVSEYHYDKGKKYSEILNRAILNNKNPTLGAYGYALYTLHSATGDFYVKYNDDYSLYIPFEVYLKGKKEEVDRAILAGLKNTAYCTKAITDSDQDIEDLFKEIKQSSLYKDILNL